jgi:transglutaminase-like putative cysteine protease
MAERLATEPAMESDLDLEQFLVPAPGIQCDHPEVRALARQIAQGSANETEAAGRLFAFVRDTVRYSVRVNFWELDQFLALNTLARGHGFCVQKSALLTALARSLGIPARLGFADIHNHQIRGPLAEAVPDGIIYHHCFTEWWVGGAWRKATPSFDAGLTRELGWRLVEFAPDRDLLLPASDLAGQPHISYLAYHGWRLGVPLEEFLAVVVEKHGREGLEGWKRLAGERRA